MKSQLSLRQHKIIQTMRNRKTYMTSEEIADLLNVSSRTIRTDISDINRALAPEGIRIDSVKSKGFILRAENPALLKKFSKDHRIFLGRTDRVYYLAVRLCASLEPINLYDLESELAVSSSTLSGDLSAFRGRFVNGVPYIKLTTSKSTILLERNERKRRFILTKLLSDNWDYHSTGNSYYESDYIDSDAFAVINSVVGGTLYRHKIYLDDYNLISLNLYLSVSYHRLKDGYTFDAPASHSETTDEILAACRELFDILEEKLDFCFPEEEIYETALIIHETGFPLDTGYTELVFPPEYHEIANNYLSRVRDVFGLDLFDDEEFCQGLLTFVSRMFRTMKDLTVRDTPDHIKHHLFAEWDVASLFYDVTKGICHVTEDDLLYLSWTISGASFGRFSLHPEERFKTIVLSHMSVHSMWTLKRALMNQFGGYLDIKEIIPVNFKDFYDFSGIKLILTTVNKTIPNISGKNVIRISPYLSREDSQTIANYIRHLRIQTLYPKNVRTVAGLLENAFIHEKERFTSKTELIRFMAKDFLDAGIFTTEHVSNILEHESVSTFAFDPTVVLLFSTLDAPETKLSLLTLDHRIMWNNYKIRIVFMVSLKKEDRNELFYLQNAIFHRGFDSEKMKYMKTKDEILEYYRNLELR